MKIKKLATTTLLSLCAALPFFTAHANEAVIDESTAQQKAKDQAGGGNPMGSATLKDADTATPYYEVKLLMESGEVRVVRVEAKL